MRRLIAIIMAFIIVLSFTACGDSTETATPDGEKVYVQANNPIIEYLYDGYYLNGESYTESELVVELVDNDRSDFVTITVAWDAEQYEAFSNLDSLADDYEDQKLEFYNSLPDDIMELRLG